MLKVMWLVLTNWIAFLVQHSCATEKFIYKICPMIGPNVLQMQSKLYFGKMYLEKNVLLQNGPPGYF